MTCTCWKRAGLCKSGLVAISLWLYLLVIFMAPFLVTKKKKFKWRKEIDFLLYYLKKIKNYVKKRQCVCFSLFSFTFGFFHVFFFLYINHLDYWYNHHGWQGIKPNYLSCADDFLAGIPCGDSHLLPSSIRECGRQKCRQTYLKDNTKLKRFSQASVARGR